MKSGFKELEETCKKILDSMLRHAQENEGSPFIFIDCGKTFPPNISTQTECPYYNKEVDRELSKGFNIAYVLLECEGCPETGCIYALEKGLSKQHREKIIEARRTMKNISKN